MFYRIKWSRPTKKFQHFSAAVILLGIHCKQIKPNEDRKYDVTALPAAIILFEMLRPEKIIGALKGQRDSCSITITGRHEHFHN